MRQEEMKHKETKKNIEDEYGGPVVHNTTQLKKQT